MHRLGQVDPDLRAGRQHEEYLEQGNCYRDHNCVFLKAKEWKGEEIQSQKCVKGYELYLEFKVYQQENSSKVRQQGNKTHSGCNSTGRDIKSPKH